MLTGARAPALHRNVPILGRRRDGRPIFPIAGGDGSTFPQDLRDERGRVMGELDVLFRTAHEDGERAFTDEEQTTHDRLAHRFEDLTGQINRHGGSPGPVIDTGTGPRPAARRRSPGEALVLSRSDSLTDALRPTFDVPPEDLSLGRFVRAMVTGDWAGAPAEAEVMRTQAIAPATLGGVFAPEALSSQVIDLARNQARVMQAGAQTVVMESGDYAIGRVAGDPSAAWKNENAGISASSGQYEKIVFHAKTLVAMVQGSVESFEDTSNFAPLLESQLGKALALELDRAALRGTGVDPEPRGLLNHSEVPQQGLGGAPANFDFLSTAVQTIWTANGEPGAMIAAPRTAGELDRLKDTTNQPLVPPESVKALNRLVTSQVPITDNPSANKSAAYIGDFSQLMVGMRTQLQIEATRVGGSTSGGAFEKLQVWIRAYLRADIQVAQPKFFVIVTGIA